MKDALLHNPRCSKSRGEPLSLTELRDLVRLLGARAAALCVDV